MYEPLHEKTYDLVHTLNGHHVQYKGYLQAIYGYMTS